MPTDQTRKPAQPQPSARKPMPVQQEVGVTSATRFLHVKRFRLSRVKGLFGIAAIVLAVAFIAVCVVVYLTSN